MTPVVVDAPKEPTTAKQKDRRDRILTSARRAFARNSFHKVLMDDVAAEAGVGKGTIYRYFPNKESLYLAVIFGGLQDLQDQIRTTRAEEEDLESAIRGLVQTLVSFFLENRLFFNLMNQEDSRSPGETPNRERWWEERSKLIDAIVEVLERGRRMGRLDVRHPTAEAQILLGMVRSVLIYSVDMAPEAVTEEISRIYLNGMMYGRQ
jgi:TetR/AcrR family fatty acid metabolism transcriptional regulator